MNEYNAETAIPEDIKALGQCLDRRQSAYIEELGGYLDSGKRR